MLFIGDKHLKVHSTSARYFVRVWRWNGTSKGIKVQATQLVSSALASYYSMQKAEEKSMQKGIVTLSCSGSTPILLRNQLLP